MSQLPNTEIPIVIDFWQDSLQPPLNLEHSPILRIPFFPISTTLSLAIIILLEKITPPNLANESPYSVSYMSKETQV